MRARTRRIRFCIVVLAGAAVLALTSVSDAGAAKFNRSFSVNRAPAMKSTTIAPRNFNTSRMKVSPNTYKYPKGNLVGTAKQPKLNVKKLAVPNRKQPGPKGTNTGVKPVGPIGGVKPTGPVGKGDDVKPGGPAGPSGPNTGGVATNPNGPVAGTPTGPGGNDGGRPPGGRNPDGPKGPSGPGGPGRPRPGGPGIGPGVIIGTGVAIGTGVVIGTAPPAGALPPPPPGGFNPPGGPQGPRGPLTGINVPPANENRFVKNEVVLEFVGNYSPAAIAQLLARHRLQRLDQQNLALTNSIFLRARITDRRPVRTVLRGLASEVTLRSGQPNYLYALSQQAGPAPMVEPPIAPGAFVPPPDANPQATPVAAAAAPLIAKGDPAQYTLGKLQLAKAHGLSLGQNVLVAVIDSGVDVSHPELAGVIVGTFDALGRTERPHNHGTAVSGAIAARARLLGVAPEARILAIRAFGATKTSAEATTFAILKGIEHATARGARVINMSFAGPFDPGLARHLAAAYARGAVLVAASGNFGPKSPPQYPAADPHVIAVTATDAEDNLFVASNRGNHVAIAAPGVDILVPAPDANYWMASGTSFAAAHVSGVAALILARQPGLSPDAVRQILLATARDLGPPGRDPQFGVGLADAYQAALAGGPRTVATPNIVPEANSPAR
jgi:hypothetical protein